MRVRYNKNQKWCISEHDYVLFTLYSAPLIDVINSFLVIAQVIRTVLIVINIWLISRHIPKKWKRDVKALVFFCFFVVLQFSIILLFANFESVNVNLGFNLKIILFLSETILLFIAVDRRLINKSSIDSFWKYSCLVVPALILIANVIKINIRGTAGWFVSTNAMSIVLTIQFVICLYLIDESKKMWLLLVLQMLAVLILGTKSPIVFIVLIVVACILFYSKHRIQVIIISFLGGICVYYVLVHYFSNQLDAILSYQQYHMTAALDRGDFFSYLFSGRNNLLYTALAILREKSLLIIAVLLGVSPYVLFSLNGMMNNSSIRGIELDPAEILLSDGILFFLWIYSYYIRMIKIKLYDKKKNFILNCLIICLLLYSILGGHGITEAISATYSSIVIATKYVVFAEENNE